MRRMAIGLALVGMAFQAWASKSVTVDELKQTVAAEHGKPDAEVAQDLLQLELSQRLNQSALAGLKAAAPGEKTAQQLDLLADQSAFLPLPPADIPSAPPPDTAAQRAIVAQMVNYITKTIHQMPDFAASRVTSSFEDRPQGILSYLPLHPVRQSTVSVVYQGGQEVDTIKGKKKRSSPDGLVSWGEFGPILSTVLLDAAQSQFVWGHWEQEAGSHLAVFRYQVPPKKSHYEVQFCCVIQGRVADPDSFGGEWYRQAAGYHGEMAVDPATGAIRRLTVVADLSPDSPMLSASIAVSYGAVEIGGKNYICPVRSVAIATKRLNVPQHGVLMPQEMSHGPITTQLNEVAFEHYRMFRGEARILTDEEAKVEGAPLPPASSDETAQPAASEAATAPPVTAPAEQNPDEHAMVAAPQPPPSQPTPAPAPAASTPQPAAIAVDTKTSAQPEVPLFKTTSREVLVDVVVTKKDGDPVLGLDKQDFEVKEDGKTQAINFFEPHTNENLKPSAPPEMPQLPAGSVTNVPPAPPSDAINVLLIDVLNTETQDTSNVRKQVMEFLAKMQPDTRMAIFVLGSQLRCLQGFTSDSSALLAALRDKNTGLNGEKSQFLNTRSDKAGNDESIAMLKVMDQGMSTAGIDAMASALSNADQRNAMLRVSLTLEALTFLGHYLSGIPGRKNLIWFSGSFPVALFPPPEVLEKLRLNPLLPDYLKHLKRAEDLFTVSQIAIYPISSEGMMNDHLAEADSSGPGAPLGAGHAGGGGEMRPYHEEADIRANNMSIMEQIAGSTGGKAYFNTNDLNGALRNAIADGSEYYTVGYTPTDSKMDGRLRHLSIKVVHGKYKLSYRQGYNADGSPARAAQSGGNPLTPLLQLGLPSTSGILYGVHAAPAAVQPAPGGERAGQNPRLLDPVTRYSVDFVIRAQDLNLQPGTQGGRTGKVLLGLKAYDPNGAALNWAGDEETIQVEPSQYESVRTKGIPVHLDIDVPASGKVDLVTAVYDMDSGTAGTLEIPLRTASQPAGTAAR